MSITMMVWGSHILQSGVSALGTDRCVLTGPGHTEAKTKLVVRPGPV